MTNPFLNALEDVGYALDTPGALLRGLLSGRPGSRASGRDMLESWGVLDPNREGLDAGDVAGFGADLLVDPLNLIGGSWLSKLLKNSSRLKKLEGMRKAFEALEPTAKTTAMELKAPEYLNDARRVLINQLDELGNVPDEVLPPLSSDPTILSRMIDDSSGLPVTRNARSLQSDDWLTWLYRNKAIKNVDASARWNEAGARSSLRDYLPVHNQYSPMRQVERIENKVSNLEDQIRNFDDAARLELQKYKQWRDVSNDAGYAGNTAFPGAADQTAAGHRENFRDWIQDKLAARRELQDTHPRLDRAAVEHLMQGPLDAASYAEAEDMRKLFLNWNRDKRAAIQRLRSLREYNTPYYTELLGGNPLPDAPIPGYSPYSDLMHTPPVTPSSPIPNPYQNRARNLAAALVGGNLARTGTYLDNPEEPYYPEY